MSNIKSVHELKHLILTKYTKNPRRNKKDSKHDDTALVINLAHQIGHFAISLWIYLTYPSGKSHSKELGKRRKEKEKENLENDWMQLLSIKFK